MSENKKKSAINQGDLARIRAERDKQKQLKIRYRNQRDNMKKFADGVVQENAKLHFTLYEALARIEELEKYLADKKIRNMSEKRE